MRAELPPTLTSSASGLSSGEAHLSLMEGDSRLNNKPMQSVPQKGDLANGHPHLTTTDRSSLGVNRLGSE